MKDNGNKNKEEEEEVDDHNNSNILLCSIAFFGGEGMGWEGSVGMLWEWCLILHLLVIFRTP